AWGGPALRSVLAPTLRRCAGRCPPRGLTLLGAALRCGLSVPPRSAAARVAAPEGADLAWGGPALRSVRAPTLRRCAGHVFQDVSSREGKSAPASLPCGRAEQRSGVGIRNSHVRRPRSGQVCEF